MNKDMKKNIFIPNIFQSEALKEIDKAILENEKTFLIVMPSATGKTYLAAQWFKFQLQKHPKARLLYVCHNQDILSQANDKEFANCLYEFEVPRGYYNSSEKNIGQVTFATVQTLVRNLNKLPSEYFDYIIVDEAHHYRAKSFEKTIKHFSPKVLLGLTATPHRMDGKSILDVFGKIIYNASISKGIKNGLLSKIKYYFVDNDIDFSEIKFKSHGKYDEKDLNKKLCIKEYDDAIIKEYNETVKQKYNKKKTICFCATVEHAYRMEKLFNDNGIKAVSLTGKHYSETGKEITVHDARRKNIINMFKNGDYDIIFVRDLFNEGIDVPDADCIIMLRPTESSRIFTQQIGRGMRIAKGKDYLLTLDFTGNCYRCDINYEVLNDMLELDIEKDIRDRIRRKNDISEIIIQNIGCEVRLSKRKIDIIKDSEEKTITKEKLIENYWNLKNKFPDLTSVMVTKNNGSRFVLSNYVRYFGSWNKFLETIGEIVKHKIRISEEDLIKNYLDLKNKYPNLRPDIITRKNGSRFGISTYHNMFGSWNKFLEKIGEKCRKKISEEDLIKNYWDLKNKYPNLRPDMITRKNGSRFGKTTYIRQFGSWNKFLEKIGEKIEHRNRYSDEDLIKNYWNLKNKYPDLTSDMVTRENGSQFDITTYLRHFGSWNKFLKKIGEKCRKITDEDLIKNYWDLKNKYPNLSLDMVTKKNGSKFHKVTYIKRFGGWNKFLKKIGEKCRKKISEEDLIKNYWDLKNKYPNLTSTMVNRKNGSKFVINTYMRMFGSWKKFLQIINQKSNMEECEKEECRKNIIFIQDYTPKNSLPDQTFDKHNKKYHSSPGIDPDTLSGYEYAGSIEKDDIRYKIIDKIRDGDTILILESPELDALKEIEKQRKNPKKIIIPNNFVFEELATALKYFDTNLNIEVINTSVLQYLVDHSEECFNFLWLDYNGAFSYYTRDLDALFQREIKEMKLILTYNTFDPRKQDDTFYFANVIGYVLKKLRGKNEILLMEDISYRYKKTMFSVGFDIKNLISH